MKQSELMEFSNELADMIQERLGPGCNYVYVLRGPVDKETQIQPGVVAAFATPDQMMGMLAQAQHSAFESRRQDLERLVQSEASLRQEEQPK